MTNFNYDLFSVATTIFKKYDRPTRHHPVEPWPDDLWDQLRDTGFTAIGRDAALEDHAALAKAVGEYAVSLPVVDVGLARWVADLVGLEAPDDAVVICAGLSDRDQLEGRLNSAGELSVSGLAHRVPWGRHAHLFLVPVDVDGDMHWALVDRGGLELRQSVNLAGEPRDLVQFEETVVAAASVVGDGPRRKEVRARGALLRSASSIGAMEYILDTTLHYAGQRVQFGRPISAFQSIQHHLVLIAEAVASVSSAVEAAVFSPPEQRIMMVAAAKIMLGEQSAILARLAHQVHGAIGATEEHPLQLRTRRLWSWQDEFGTTTDWAVDLADQLVFQDSPGAWPVLTPPLDALATREIRETAPW